MNLGGRECRMLHILIVGDGVRIPAGQFNFFFFFFFVFSFLKQSFKKGFNIKIIKIKIILNMFTVTDKQLNQNIWFPFKYYSFARKC